MDPTVSASFLLFLVLPFHYCSHRCLDCIHDEQQCMWDILRTQVTDNFHSDQVSPMHKAQFAFRNSAAFHQHSHAYCLGLPGLGTSQLVGVLAMCWFPQVWKSRLTVQPGFWWWQCSKNGGPCYLVAHWYSRTWSHFTKTPGWIHTFYKTWDTL